jgi:hypothetical protein
MTNENKCVECTAESPCTAVQLLIQQQEQDHERMDKMDTLIDSLRNRLPLWATMAFTAGGGTIGVLVTLVVK